ncbi:MAG: M23 family metallopeptidase [Cyclobacteriaceae bacterium]
MTFGFLISLGIAIYLVTSVLEAWLDPRHAQMVANRQIISLSMAIDSLEHEMNAKDEFIQNIKLILSGEDVTSINEAEIQESRVANEDFQITSALDPVDSQFRADYERADLGLISSFDYSNEEIRDLYLINPVSGIVSDGFDQRAEHFGVDVVSKENEPIKCVADGVVIFSSWTLDAGYVVAVQHKGNLISVYKHNSEILKNVGSFVSTGEIIAVIGNTGELTSGPHLHFELWHRGNPVNPQDYIVF